MATRAAAPDSLPEVKPASLEPAGLREEPLNNVFDWLGKDSTGSKDSLPPIGPELLGLRAEV